MKRVLIGLLLLFAAKTSFSQQQDWKYSPYFAFGVNIYPTFGSKQFFPGFNLYGGFAVSAVYRERFIANYGGNISFYRKTVGTNLNPLIDNLEIDFTNSFSAGVGGNSLSYPKLIRTLHNSAFYNLNLSNNYFALLTTNVVFNNHKRNQTVGSVTLSGPGLSFNYYNDGAFPVKAFAGGDGFDRWWTGGGSFYLHSRRNYNYVELSFDQFTGYQPFLYELSDILGISLPPYSKDSTIIDKKNIHSNYNSAQYKLRIGLNKNFSVDAGVLGSLRYGDRDRIFSFQDLIHVLGKMPMHPNNDQNRVFIGGSFNQLNRVQIK